MGNKFVTKENLNPCYAQYGYYGIKKGKLVLKQFVVTEVNGDYGYTYFVSLKKDTLELINKKFPEYIYMYIYVPIPKEWLTYTPDW
jgi:hypothetical protein